MQNWIRKVKLNRGVINFKIVMAGDGLLKRSLTEKNIARFVGYIKIIKHFAKSILHHMDFVKRIGTKVIKALPSDFENIKSEFVKKV